MDSRQQRHIGRRAVLGAAAGALAALVAACSGPDGDTTFRPARTATAPRGGGVGTPNVVENPTEPPIVGTPIGTIFPTPKRGAPVPDFLRMVGLAPNGMDAAGGLLTFLDHWKGYLSFANLGEVKRLYGYEKVRAFTDLAAQNIAVADYTNATAGCYLTEFVGLRYAQGQYRDAFGYDVLLVDREISVGQPIEYLSRMEGTFDADGVVGKLQAGGYTIADQNGVAYYTVRGDGEQNFSDPRSRLALGRMNRVAVDTERIIAAPKTALIAAALDAEARRTTTLDATAALRALVTVLGTVTSMATIPPGASDVVESVLQSGQLAAMTSGWEPLHPAELSAIGYTDAGNFQRTMHVALVYTKPADAAADAPELVKRITGYRSLRSRQPLLPTYATAVTSRTATVAGKGVLVADVALAPDPPRARFWIDLFLSRDTLFLVPQPLSIVGTPPARGSAVSGTPRP